MYEDIFQVKSNDLAPEPGRILIASPLLNDYHFQRTVTMMISHNEDNDIGLVINKEFRTQMYLNELIRELKDVPKIPLFKGGPVDRYNLTFIHNIEEIDKSIDHLQKIKANLLSSENNLRLANNKAEDLSIKKLTANAPSIAEKFEELGAEVKKNKKKK